MAHNTDPAAPTPPDDPHAAHPQPEPTPPPAPEPPLELEFDEVEVVEPEIVEVVEPEVVEAEPAEGAVSFDLPPGPTPTADAAAERTIGASLDALAAEHPELLAAFGTASAAGPGAEAEPVDVPANLEPVVPVVPASGWFTPDDEAPPPVVRAVEGSDIFSGGDVPAAEEAGASSIYDPPRGRPSDVALAFDQPPGGSTVADARFEADLPFAEEIPESTEELMFAGDEDGDGFAHPDLRDDAIDTGAAAFGPDASSILDAELSDPKISADTSAVLLESPGMERTLTDDLPVGELPPPDPGAEAAFDLAMPDDLGEAPSDLDKAAAAGTSDLFHRSGKSQPDFELPDSGAVAAFDALPETDQPSLTSSPSSIFSGHAPGKAGSGTGGSADVPVGNPDLGASGEVEFTAYPADSGSMKPGAVDFDLPKRPASPERTMPVSAEDSDAINWAGSADDVFATGGGSGVRADDYVPAAAPVDDDETEQMPTFVDPFGGQSKAKEQEEAKRARGAAKKETAKGAGKAKDAAKAKPADGSVELDWVADSVEHPVPVAEEAAEPAPPRKGKPGRRTSLVHEPDGTGETRVAAPVARRGGRGGWLFGTLLGLVVGGGAVAGLHFGGVLPAGEDKEAAAKLDQANRRAGDALQAADRAKADAEAVKKERDDLDAAAKAAAKKADDAEAAAKEAADKAAAADQRAKDAAAAAKTAKADANTALTKQQAAEKAAKDAKTAADEALEKEKVAEAARVKAEDARVAAEKAKADADAARKAADTLTASIAKELQGAKLLGEKYDAAALQAAAKEAATRASGPDVRSLLPSGAAAVAGTGLTTGQLVDLATRLGKAETAVKAADDRLAAETKKLTDAHAAEVKKLTDAAAVDLAKQKDLSAAEAKKMTEKFAADLKKLTDDHATKVKDLEAAMAAERDRAAAMAKKFETDLGNAVSPSAALDLWLEILTGLRREADAGPAIKAAEKVLASAPAGSEEAAKAHTVAGIAKLIRADADGAAKELGAARGTAAYRAAGGKGWAKAADVWQAAVEDPSAPVRRPVPEGRDPAAARGQLDTGIRAYRAGNYPQAEAVLVKASGNDPTDPVIWYYLGAARWQRGNAAQAEKDFRQGAERERLMTTSTRPVTTAIAPIQGGARTALETARNTLSARP